MCQLLRMNCNTPTNVTFSFSGFAQRGGNTGEHTDGRGLPFLKMVLMAVTGVAPFCRSPAGLHLAGG